MGGVDHAAGPVEPCCRVQFGQQHLVEALPDVGLVPVPQPAPARHPRAEPELLGKVFPLDASVQDVQNPAQHPTVGNRQSAGVSEAAFLLRQ